MGLGDEKVTNFQKPPEREKPKNKKDKKNQNDDQKIQGLLTLLDNSSEDEADKASKHNKVQQKKEAPKADAAKPKKIQSEQNGRKLSHMESDKPSVPVLPHKKSADLSQKPNEKDSKYQGGSESSESESEKVKQIKLKSFKTGKQSIETVFKSVLSGGSEMSNRPS